MRFLNTHSKQEIISFVNGHETPLYLYSLKILREKIGEIQKSLISPFRASYSLKSNPSPQIVREMRSAQFNLDVASLGEVKVALSEGASPSSISFVGPGKRLKEIEECIRLGIAIVIESVEEFNSVAEFAKTSNLTAEIFFRLHVQQALTPAGHQILNPVNQFGIDITDISQLLKLTKPQIKLKGFHWFFQSMNFKEDTIVQNFGLFLDQVNLLTKEMKLHPLQLIFGPGLGISYGESQNEILFSSILLRLHAEMEKRSFSFKIDFINLEMGRYLVGNSGIFLTNVLYTKILNGKKIAIVDGGFSANMAACGVGQNIRKWSFIKNLSRDTDDGPGVLVAGPSCYSMDLMALEAQLGPVAAGDLLGIFPAGAYGPTFSPIQFLGLPQPTELFLE